MNGTAQQSLRANLKAFYHQLWLFHPCDSSAVNIEAA
jgi:hypothetical protein